MARLAVATGEKGESMQYAVVDDSRREAFPAGRGACPGCGFGVVAKCRPRVLHHWAHSRRRDCDPWWETETEWHRAWKALFPPECREVTTSPPMERYTAPT